MVAKMAAPASGVWRSRGHSRNGHDSRAFTNLLQVREAIDTDDGNRVDAAGTGKYRQRNRRRERRGAVGRLPSEPRPGLRLAQDLHDAALLLQ